jgi:hypothetical protein
MTDRLDTLWKEYDAAVMRRGANGRIDAVAHIVVLRAGLMREMRAVVAAEDNQTNARRATGN